ncbi:hypothetical protein INT45_006595 [Circinella minor]|uniref:Mannosyltransferase n=1 Tax=Circinella minor TaxID=1195481 RepID=A0A8H7S915_9FUNG|nr:hypothetical protein INT45_006595 [Circinella minor]
MLIKLLVFLFITLYCLLCPYTKVEESFNIQAAHDVMHHGGNINAYDHVEFPGVVPRSFLGSIILGSIAQAIVTILRWIHFDIKDGITEQLIVRVLLGALVSLALIRIQVAIKRLFGYPASVAFVLLTCCQFHFIFWSSRTLPNTIALPLVLSGLSHWMESLVATAGRETQLRDMIRDLVIAGILFRFEAGILLVIILGMEWLVYRTLSFKFMFVHTVSSVLVSLILTVSVDSYFWQRDIINGELPLWPEGMVFYFNAILNKSSEWGTLPFYAYFVLFLPRLLLISYPLACIAFIRDGRVRRIMSPMLIYICLFSLVPHKEWRFIIYTIPIFTAAAAALLGNVFSVYYQTSRIKTLLVILVAGGGILVSLGCSLFMLWISIQNYPGGHALHRLHEIANSDVSYGQQPQVSVHMDVSTAMTGASRFGQVAHPGWSYHKNESHTTPDDYIEAEYTHLITSDPGFHHQEFQLVDQTFGLEAVKLKSPKVYLDQLQHFVHNPHVLLPVDIIIQPKLYTLKLMNPQTTWIQYTLRKYPVVLYSKTYCPFCKRAKQILDKYCKNNYFIVEVDQREDSLAMKQALIGLSGRHTFPNLFVNGQSIGGSDELVRLEKLGKLSEIILPCIH